MPERVRRCGRVVLLGGKVLDGRNRLKACNMAGVKPRFVKYTGTDPLAFVLLKNLDRRHLSESQRSMVAAKLANMKQGERTDLQPSPNLEKVATTVSVPKAAEMLNVGPSNVYKARQVQRDGSPDLVKAVEAGEVSLNAAEVVAKLPKGEQAEVVQRGPEAVKEKAAEVRAKQKQPSRSP